jgi:hypothetical protein
VKGAGAHDSYVARGRSYDPRPPVCQCDRSWDDGGETCVRCGRQLRALGERASALARVRRSRAA